MNVVKNNASIDRNNSCFWKIQVIPLTIHYYGILLDSQKVFFFLIYKKNAQNLLILN